MSDATAEIFQAAWSEIKDAELRFARRPDQIVITKGVPAGSMVAVEDLREDGWEAFEDDLPRPTHSRLITLQIHPEDWKEMLRDLPLVEPPLVEANTNSGPTRLFGIPVAPGIAIKGVDRQ